MIQKLIVLALLSTAAFGCIGISPEERAQRAAYGDRNCDDDDGDEEHCPGQPCLVCHSEDFHPGDDEFQVAGTIYLTPEDDRGLGGAEVLVTDANDQTALVTTNRAGNFMIARGREERGEGRDGKIRVPWEITYPIRVRVSYSDSIEDVAMESVVWREGSCAHCHRHESRSAPHTGDARHEGHIYLTNDPTTVPYPPPDAVPPPPPAVDNDWARHVQPYAARRCGTLDCHGDPGRPYRVYSVEGLRDSPDRRAALSTFEIEGNEASARTVSPGADANSHALLLKPLATTGGGWDHVGEEIWISREDTGYRCFQLWLEGGDPEAACAEAVAAVPRGTP